MKRMDALHFTWEELSGFASRALSDALAREIKSVVSADDETYWSIRITNMSISIEEEYMLLKKIGADENDYREVNSFYHVNPSVTSIRDFTMGESIKIIGSRLSFNEIVSTFIDEDGIWFIGK